MKRIMTLRGSRRFIIKQFLFLLLFSISLSSCVSNDTNENKARFVNVEKLNNDRKSYVRIQDNQKLPNKVTSLPVGIRVKHSKRKAFAELNTSHPQRGGTYRWNYATSVTPLVDSLTIIEFGAFILEDGKWVERTIYGRPFNGDEFEQWYKCKNALLIKGRKYFDKNNWTSANDINAGSKSLWYYIGVDKNKKKYVGYAVIKTIAKLKNK